MKELMKQYQAKANEIGGNFVGPNPGYSLDENENRLNISKSLREKLNPKEAF